MHYLLQLTAYKQQKTVTRKATQKNEKGQNGHKWNAKTDLNFNHFWPIIPFHTLADTGKPMVGWCFQGFRNGALARMG